MPDIMRDYHLWWLDFWAAHPVIFWTVAAVAIALPYAVKRIRF